MGKATDRQVGGNHYQDMQIQPATYIHANQLGFLEGSVVKCVSRHRAKGGAEDIRKAIHFLELILELEYQPVQKEVEHNIRAGDYVRVKNDKELGEQVLRVAYLDGSAVVLDTDNIDVPYGRVIKHFSELELAYGG